MPKNQSATEDSRRRASATGYDSDIPRHRKRASAKPYKLEGRLPAHSHPNGIFGFWKDWVRKSSHETQAQAEQAMNDIKARPFWKQMEWRVTSES